MAAFQTLIEDAGFDDVRFSDKRYDTFSGAPQASSAEAFGTQGVDIWAIKPAGPRRSTSGSTGRVSPEPESPVRLDDLPRADDLYDAGSLGCAEGPIMEIARRMKAMSPGAVLEIRSTDPGVAADLPAWCRMVGHTYLGQGKGNSAGRYFVQLKDD